MQRYFLELAYKGTDFSGFQVQENANTVQQELSRAMETLFRRPFELTGSSRTDAGVHARQNYFHFDSEIAVPSASVYNLNAILPAAITVKGVYPVAATAHCRFDAVAREYRYYIYRRKDPFMADRGWLYAYPLELEVLQQMGRVLMEYTDFTSFAKRNTQVKTFLCSISRSEWYIEGDLLVYQVSGNRFLRGMVRGLVATMLKLGRERFAEEELRKILIAKNNTLADFSAPPQGLFLESVQYPPELSAFLR
jgi:tRNA pseudouridine38-40 synthase